MICLGIHSNVMLRFMVQAFQDPPLCSSTSTWPNPGGNMYLQLVFGRISRPGIISNATTGLAIGTAKRTRGGRQEHGGRKVAEAYVV